MCYCCGEVVADIPQILCEMLVLSGGSSWEIPTNTLLIHTTPGYLKKFSDAAHINTLKYAELQIRKEIREIVRAIRRDRNIK